MNKRVVISGYPTLDYVAATAAPQIGAGTTLVRLALPQAWPRAGGAALYAGARLAAAGLVTHPLLAIGDDPHGTLFSAACRQASLQTDGITIAQGAMTPVCVLVHAPNGASQCLLDAGSTPQALTQAQLDLAARADMVVLAASHPEATRALFAALLPHQKLAWIVKGDGASFPPDLCGPLAARADFIFCNNAERGLVGTPNASCILIETFGASGLAVSRDGVRRHYAVTAQAVTDTTGAGDTMAGEMLARLSLTPGDTQNAAASGIAAVRALLAARA